MSSYNYELSNGRTITINDGEVNSSEVPTAIPGRGAYNWGIYLDQGLLHTIENFYNTTSPANPMEGQLFYKQPVQGSAPTTVNDTLQVCVQNKTDPTWGTDVYNKYKYIPLMYKETVVPTTLPQWSTYPHLALGDLWYNQSTSKLAMYTSAGWVQLLDTNSVINPYQLITENVTLQTVTIVNNTVISAIGVKTPAIQLTGTEPVITAIANSSNITLNNDTSIPTTKYVNTKVSNLQPIYIWMTSNYLLDSAVYNPASAAFVNGQQLAFKNLGSTALTITANNSVTIDGHPSIIIGPKEAIWLNSYNSQWVIM